MSYETKVIFAAMADILKTSATLEEAYERLTDIANAEGQVLKPYENKCKKG